MVGWTAERRVYAIVDHSGQPLAEQAEAIALTFPAGFEVVGAFAAAQATAAAAASAALAAQAAGFSTATTMLLIAAPSATAGWDVTELAGGGAEPVAAEYAEENLETAEDAAVLRLRLPLSWTFADRDVAGDVAEQTEVGTSNFELRHHFPPIFLSHFGPSLAHFSGSTPPHTRRT